MSTIKVKVTDQLAEFIDTPPIAAGDVNVDAVQFDFSNEWKSGFELMGVFWRADSKTKYTCLIDENYTATVPSEVMKSEGIVVFGVCGISTSKTLTSSTLSYTILDGAVVKFDTANVDIYDELIKLFKNTKITSGQITSNGHLVFKKVDGTTVDVGSGISLTTEQVNSAFNEFITEYAEEMDYTKVNIAVITRLKELNKQAVIQFWAGTKAEYNAITPEDNVFYIITDEDPLEAIEKKAEQNASDISSLTTTVNSLKNITGSTLSTTTTDITVKRTNSTGNTTETATWYIHKFDDGVLEAWANVQVDKVDCNTAVGSGYGLDGWYRSGLQTVNVAFPSDFSNIDFVGVENPFMYFAGGMSKYQHITALNSSKSAAVTVYSSTSSDGTPVVFGLKLTGRWK